ncbi:MAG: hypothetical protein RMY16_07205 [Nostoc sp. DedQUE12b]|uniref:hypothetical protein n=1 Tax=Nostoc sp. DedQUE12b TaxID=3075398 RepID=UPI002AD348F7|nr:hypothetical protein [Nostoc sp. DedQUE12b]MDZ8085368.1 hypothetical protein [Nostoc sp. DedQUE12b]
MKKSIMLSIPLAFALGSICSGAASANNILINSGFESGSAGWVGTALNYFGYNCSQSNFPAIDGQCFALFTYASGTSLTQHNKIPRSGYYQASVALMGTGNVRFGIWAFCPGAAPSSYGFGSVNLTNSWQTLKVKTGYLNGCEVKWELYIDSDSLVLVDAARLYETF